MICIKHQHPRQLSQVRDVIFSALSTHTISHSRAMRLAGKAEITKRNVMKAIVSVLVSLLVVAGVASTSGSAANNRRDRIQRADDCVVTGWTSGSWTRPIFKCPDRNEKIHRAR